MDEFVLSILVLCECNESAVSGNMLCIMQEISGHTGE